MQKTPAVCKMTLAALYPVIYGQFSKPDSKLLEAAKGLGTSCTPGAQTLFPTQAGHADACDTGPSSHTMSAVHGDYLSLLFFRDG